MPFTPRIVIVNPAPGDKAVIKGFAWTVTGTVVSVKITKLEYKCSASGGSATPHNLLINLTKTGDFVTVASNVTKAIVADGAVHDLASTPIDFSSVPLSIAEAASGDVGVVLDWDAVFVHCKVEIGDVVMEVCQSATDPVAYGLGYGEFNNADEYDIVIGGTIKSEPASYVDSASADHWVAQTVPETLNDADWTFWQYNGELYATNPDFGTFYKNIGESTWKRLFKAYTIATNASVDLSRPPYLGITFPAADYTLAAESGDQSTARVCNGDGTLKISFARDIVNVKTAKVSASMNSGSVDMSGVDCVHFVLTCPVDGITYFDANKIYYGFGLSESTGAGAYSAAQSVTIEVSADRSTVHVFADISNIANANKDAVKRFVFQFGVHPRLGVDFTLGGFYAGGRYLEASTSSYTIPNTGYPTNPLEYAVFAADATDTNKSTPTLKTIDGQSALGLRGSSNTPFLMSFVTATANAVVSAPWGDGVNPIGSSKLVLCRKKTNGQYAKVAEVVQASGVNTVTDRLTQYEVDALSTYTVPGGGVTDPSGSGGVTGVVCGLAWRGANCYFSTDGKGYFSQVNFPKNVEWPQIVLGGSTASAINQARTIYIADNQGLPVLAAVASAALYLFTRKQTYYMIGETPAVASFPLALDGARGVTGRRAACAYGPGALFGSDDGLWYVVKYDTGNVEPETLREVTKDVRPTWRWLLGSVADHLVVRHAAGDIWCFVDTRFVHIRRSGEITRGEWAHGKKVIDAYGDPKRGMVLLFRDGSLGVTGAYTTDGATNLAGTNGAAAAWSATSRRVLGSMNILRAEAVYEVPALPALPSVQVTAYTQRGSGSGDSVSMTDRAGFGNKPFARLVGSGKVGGRYSEFKIEGANVDIVESVIIQGTLASDGRGAV